LRRRLVRLWPHGGGSRAARAGAPPAARDDGPPAARDLAHHLRAADAGARRPDHPGRCRPPDRHAARPRRAARGDGARARSVRARGLMETVEQVLDSLSNFVWGWPLLVLLVGTHLYLTVRLRFIQRYFATLTAIAAFGIGNMVQANSISAMVVETFGVRPWITGIVITACTAVVILGGIKSIANVCEKLVPFMAVFYIVGCAILLVMHAAAIPETLRLIVSTAFTGQAAVGGFAGAGMREAIRFGVARGLFSN